MHKPNENNFQVQKLAEFYNKNNFCTYTEISHPPKKKSKWIDSDIKKTTNNSCYKHIKQAQETLGYITEQNKILYFHPKNHILKS